MSLQYDMADESNDEAWIGTSSFLREEGINHSAIDNWRKAKRLRELPERNDFYYKEGQSPHWCIVSDLREHELYKERPFVRRSENVRFFFSVPLRDKQGSVIGSYTVLDDKPRYGVSVNDMAFLEDMADTVTEHLDATMVRSQRQRSERLIQGLGLFNTGKDSLREWWLTQEATRLRKGGRYQDVEGLDTKMRQERGDEEFGAQEQPGDARHGRGTLALTKAAASKMTSGVARGNSAAASDRRSSNVASQDFDVTPASNAPVPLPDFVSRDLHPPADNAVPNKKQKSNRFPTKDFDLVAESDQAYARASNLMREALNTEGVIFLNANISSLNPGRSWLPKGASDTESTASPWTSTTDDHHLDSSDTEGVDLTPGETCKINGYSTRVRSSLTTGSSSTRQFSLSEKYLARLVKCYPQGKIFNFGEGGAPYSSSGEETASTASGDNLTAREDRRSRDPVSRQRGHARRLGKVLVGARTIAFYPLWDDTTDRWRSCVLVWSTTPLRFFDPAEDITYLAAFGHSLLAELSRLDTLAADKAKGTFISSVSHELRSPLHGVLAGVEFLQESELTAFQQEMVHTISMAGRTLLDTVNHILDYSKISSFTRAQRSERTRADSARHHTSVPGDVGELGVTSHIDLARLTEEVVETVAIAHRFQGLSKGKTATTRVEKSGPNNVKQRISRLSAETNPLSIIVNIAYRDSWVVEISPGSWTRVLTNIIGNAFKYTKHGTISVRLDIGVSTDPDSKSIQLTVEDTGPGISQKFLNNYLFTPFKQENSHSSGMGLGLSIVKQISKDLNANLKVTSRLGKGTTVTMDLIAKFVTSSPLTKQLDDDTRIINAVDKLSIKHFHLLTPNTKDDAEDGPQISRLGTSVLETGRSWLGCEASSGPLITATSEPSILAICEEDLLDLLDNHPDQVSAMFSSLKAQQAHVLILGSSVQSLSTNLVFEDFSIKAVLINQPIGPRKLLRAIMSSEDATASQDSGDYALYNVKNQSTSPGLARTMSVASDSDEPRGHFPWLSKPTSIGISGFEAEFNAIKSADTSPVSSLQRKATRPRVQRRVTTPAALQSPPIITPSGLNEPESPFAARYRESLPTRTTILLVEDNPINMKLLVALMSKLHVTFATAKNGLEALNMYSANPELFFLVLMDMSMPIMDGFTSTARIRAVEKKRKLLPCPIVALTGVTSESARADAFNAGVTRFLTKPISMVGLKALVKEFQD